MTNYRNIVERIQTQQVELAEAVAADRQSLIDSFEAEYAGYTDYADADEGFEAEEVSETTE